MTEHSPCLRESEPTQHHNESTDQSPNTSAASQNDLSLTPHSKVLSFPKISTPRKAVVNQRRIFYKTSRLLTSGNDIYNAKLKEAANKEKKKAEKEKRKIEREAKKRAKECAVTLASKGKEKGH